MTKNNSGEGTGGVCCTINNRVEINSFYCLDAKYTTTKKATISQKTIR